MATTSELCYELCEISCYNKMAAAHIFHAEYHCVGQQTPHFYNSDFSHTSRRAPVNKVCEWFVLWLFSSFNP